MREEEGDMEDTVTYYLGLGLLKLCCGCISTSILSLQCRCGLAGGIKGSLQ